MPATFAPVDVEYKRQARLIGPFESPDVGACVRLEGRALIGGMGLALVGGERDPYVVVRGQQAMVSGSRRIPAGA